MKVSTDDIKYTKKEKLIVLGKDGAIKKIIDNYKIIDNRVYECRADKSLPIYNSNLFSNEETEMYRNSSSSYREEFDRANTDRMMCFGLNVGGTSIKYYSDYFIEEEIKKINKSQDNIRIIEKYSQGNLLYGTHLVLSERISKEAWNKVKHCFRYTNTKDFNDEVWGDYFIGYEVLKDKIKELEEILKIPDNLNYESFIAEKEQEKLRKELYKQERAEFMKELDSEFNYELQEDISEYVADLKKRNEFVVIEGDRIGYVPEDMYGNGIWYIVQDDYIWKVINNGADGDMWQLNFIHTGGAGAYGLKFKKTDRKMELLKNIHKYIKY